MNVINEWVSLGLLMACSWTDIRYGKIPNGIVCGGCIFGLVINSLLDGRVGLCRSIYGIGLSFICLILFYGMGLMGAGDVKLIGMLGSIWGGLFSVKIFILGCLLEGMIEGGNIVYRRLPGKLKWSGLKGCYTQSQQLLFHGYCLLHQNIDIKAIGQLHPRCRGRNGRKGWPLAPFFLIVYGLGVIG